MAWPVKDDCGLCLRSFGKAHRKNTTQQPLRDSPETSTGLSFEAAVQEISYRGSELAAHIHTQRPEDLRWMLRFCQSFTVLWQEKREHLESDYRVIFLFPHMSSQAGPKLAGYSTSCWRVCIYINNEMIYMYMYTYICAHIYVYVYYIYIYIYKYICI